MKLSQMLLVTVVLTFTSAVALAQSRIKGEAESFIELKTSDGLVEHGKIELEYEAEEGGMAFCSRYIIYDRLDHCDRTVLSETYFAPYAFQVGQTYFQGKPQQYTEYSGIGIVEKISSYGPPCNSIYTSTKSYEYLIKDFVNDDLYSDRIVSSPDGPPLCGIPEVPIEIKQ